MLIGSPATDGVGPARMEESAVAVHKIAVAVAISGQKESDRRETLSINVTTIHYRDCIVDTGVKNVAINRDPVQCSLKISHRRRDNVGDRFSDTPCFEDHRTGVMSRRDDGSFHISLTTPFAVSNSRFAGRKPSEGSFEATFTIAPDTSLTGRSTGHPLLRSTLRGPSPLEEGSWALFGLWESVLALPESSISLSLQGRRIGDHRNQNSIQQTQANLTITASWLDRPRILDNRQVKPPRCATSDTTPSPGEHTMQAHLRGLPSHSDQARLVNRQISHQMVSSPPADVRRPSKRIAAAEAIQRIKRLPRPQPNAASSPPNHELDDGKLLVHPNQQLREKNRETLTETTFYRSLTRTRVSKGEVASYDSDDEPPNRIITAAQRHGLHKPAGATARHPIPPSHRDSPVLHMHASIINSYADLTVAEKAFIKRWDAYAYINRPLYHESLPKVLQMFVRNEAAFILGYAVRAEQSLCTYPEPEETPPGIRKRELGLFISSLVARRLLESSAVRGIWEALHEEQVIVEAIRSVNQIDR